jgi:hypothetical protein
MRRSEQACSSPPPILCASLPIGLAALGNLLHALSHLRDWDLHMPPHREAAAGLSQQILILLPGLLLLLIALSGEHHARAVAVPARLK